MAKRKPKTTPDTLSPPPAERVYRGCRAPDAAVSVVEDGVERPLDLRLDLARHSPTGFGWNYAGSGPAQLALALAADALGDDARAKRVHQRLKLALVAGLPHSGWELTAAQVREAVAALEQGRGVTTAGRTSVADGPSAAPDTNLSPPADEPPAPPNAPPPSEPPSSRAVEPSPQAVRTETVHPPEATAPAEHERPERPRVPNPFGIRQDGLAGVRLLEDRRFRQMQLAFAEKPPEHVREAVGAAGFRWLAEEQVWARQIDKEKAWQTRAQADELFERVCAMVREAKGLTREYG